MADDIEEYWTGDLIIPEGVRQKARKILRKRLPEARIRIALRMKLGKYLKVS
jgi:hypothetical protein